MKLIKKLVLVIAIQTSLNAQVADDTKHFYAGFGIQQLTTSLVHAKTNRTWLSIGLGAIAGTGAGIAKEYIYDRAMHKGTFDKVDMYTTAWGALVGCIVSRCTIEMIHINRYKKQEYKLNELKRLE